MAKLNKQPTLGVIVGNRGFFPKHLCVEGRKVVLDVLAELGIKAIIAPEDATNYGSVESMTEAHLYADLFKAHADEIDGILITLPNFGEERPIANTIRWSGLNVPVLVQAFNDDAGRMTESEEHQHRARVCSRAELPCAHVRVAPAATFATCLPEHEPSRADAAGAEIEAPPDRSHGARRRTARDAQCQDERHGDRDDSDAG